MTRNRTLYTFKKDRQNFLTSITVKLNNSDHMCYHSVISQAEEEVDRGNYKTTLESRIYPS
jgi:hypothetical protein